MLKIDLEKRFLKELPISPGCYLYKEKSGKVLYVGKAVNIRARVSSYFTKGDDLETKIQLMLKRASFVDFVEVDSEVEALILETNLIKKYRPKYNRMMKDDKSYIWVMFDNLKDFPKPEIAREKKKKRATYFGPYPKVFPARKVLRRLRKLFPYCNTNFRVKDGIGAEKRPCLDYHIGLCSGVCAGVISKQDHRRNINSIKRYFRGQKQELYKDLQKRMKFLSKARKFEQASKIRDTLRDLDYVTQRIEIDKEVDEARLSAKKQEGAIIGLGQLKEKVRLPSRKAQGFRIECYDISNIQGSSATGSMVVFVGGRPRKDQYRKFKIRTKTTPDDFEMMREVLLRRLKKVNDKRVKDVSFKKVPDLVVVDGGKGQLSAAWDILKELKLDSKIPVVGLAKREEEIFRIEMVGHEKVFRKSTFAKRSHGLYLVQRIRDEAHRFAIGYHRKLRSKQSVKSLLDDVPGVGELTKRKLLKAFGSLEGIKKAKKKDLETVVRNRRTVEAIQKVLK